MKFKEFNDLEELFMTYSKACAGDGDIRTACDHLVAVFKAAMLEDDPLMAFVGQLKKDASYASWKPDPVDAMGKEAAGELYGSLLEAHTGRKAAPDPEDEKK